MADVLKHGFVSGKVDGPDATMIQPSHWNAGHKFSGGANADLLMRDTADANFGAKWAMPMAANAPAVTYLSAGTHTIPVVRSAFHDVRCDASGGTVTINGTAAGYTAGAVVIIRNVSAGRVNIVHLGTNPWGFVNQFSSGPTPLMNGGCAIYILDASANWSQISHDQGAPYNLPFNAANYAGVTVTAGDILEHSFLIQGKTCLYAIAIGTATIVTPTSQVQVGGAPGTWSVVGPYVPGIASSTAGGWGQCLVAILGSGLLAFARPDFQNWPAGTDAHHFYTRNVLTLS